MASIRIIIPLIVSTQIAVAVGLTGVISFLNGQKAVNDVASQLRQHLATRIDEHLNEYLSTPHRVTGAVVNQIDLGLLPAFDLMESENLQTVERYLWKESQLFDSASYLFIANNQGEFVGVEQLDDGTRTIELSDRDAGGEFRTYSINSQGNHDRLLKPPSPGYDPQKRPYYQAVVSAGRSSWTEIYNAFGYAERLTITAVQPIYQQNPGQPRRLIGVVGADLILSQIHQFLNELEIGASGVAFILDPSGRLVATSAPESIVAPNPANANERLMATDSTHRLVQETAQYLQMHYGHYNIQQDAELEFRENGERNFVEVRSLQQFDLNWVIVVVIPESDFMERINANTRSTVLLCFGALIAASAIGLLTARWLIQPILTLNSAATAIESDDFTPDTHAQEFGLECLTHVGRRHDELGQLARVFQKMTHKVYLREQRLKQQVQELRIEIDQSKRQKQVREIVETDFFQDLAAKAQTLRTRNRKPTPHDTDASA